LDYLGSGFVAPKWPPTSREAMLKNGLHLFFWDTSSNYLVRARFIQERILL